MTSANRWKIKIIDSKTTKLKEEYRNQTGRQLERKRKAWASAKNKNEKYANTEFHYEAEPDLKRVK